MGRAKEALIEKYQFGFDSIGNKFVCSNCFGDEFIQEFIEDNAHEQQCDYCKQKSKEGDISLEVDRVLEFIVNALKADGWETTNEIAMYDHDAKCSISHYPCDQWDFVEDVLCIQADISNELLIEDIQNAAIEINWSRKGDHYDETENEMLVSEWFEFSELVKYKTRYVFYKTTNDFYYNQGAPYLILENIAIFVEELGLIKEMPADQNFHRAVDDKSAAFNTAKRIGTAPRECAKLPNRMSPAGIPMFYGAAAEATALLEIGFESNSNKVATIGVFKNSQPFKLLDLKNIPQAVPSVFDAKNRKKRRSIKFFREFLDDFTKLVQKEDNEHVDYVPTQIVTEYFRHVYKNTSGDNIDGIIYPSSINKEEAYVLFIENSDCVEKREIDRDKKQLYLNEYKHVDKRLIQINL